MSDFSVSSWNTALSPSMYGRLIRKEKICRNLSSIFKQVDVIALQETGSYRIGPVANFIYNRFFNFFYKNPFALMFFDYLAIAEGFIFPKYLVDNTQELISAAKEQGYKYSYSSKFPKKYLNSGLLILSKSPLRKKSEIKFKGDSIHKPGTLIVEVLKNKKPVWLYDSYFVPKLGWLKPSYFICNLLNLFSFKRTRHLRHNQLVALHKLLHQRFMISVGDFNIPRKDIEYLSAKKILRLVDSDNSDKGYTFKSLIEKKELDYIFHSKRLILEKFQHGKFTDLSDHRPIFAKFKI